MGNDARKQIPKQNHAKRPHKHHEMSTKVIHNSTRIPFNIFLREENSADHLHQLRSYHEKHSENLNLSFCLIKVWKLSHFFLMNIVVQIFITCLYCTLQSNISNFLMPDQSTWTATRTSSTIFQILKQCKFFLLFILHVLILNLLAVLFSMIFF